MSIPLGLTNALEQRTPVDLPITGTIPSWLTGILYRTGPGTFTIPSAADPSKIIPMMHWFNGPGMNHRFEIVDSPSGKRVTYTSRKSAEDLEKNIAEAGHDIGTTFGRKSDPCETIFSRFFTSFQSRPRAGGTTTTTTHRSPSGANASVTLTPDMPGWDVPSSLPVPASGPRYIVGKTDGNVLQLLDPTTLEPLQLSSYAQFAPELDGQLTAAHSCRDNRTGDFFNFTVKMGGRMPTYSVFRISAEGKVKVLATIKDAPLAYLHSFAMTEKYVVLCVWASHISYSGLSVMYYGNIAQAINKTPDPKSPSLFYVIDRHSGGLVAKYKTPPFFCFHQLNAYDDPASDSLILDMSIYPSASVIDMLYLDNMRSLSPHWMGRPRRFRLHSLSSPPRSPKESRDATSPSQSESIELPTIRPELAQRPYRFAYGIHTSSHAVADSVIKLDLSSPSSPSRARIWSAGPNSTPGEPIFVSRPGSVEEDDGVLLTVVLDGERGRSVLVVLDAGEMREVARAEMGTHFPFGFHGVFTG